IVQSTPFPARLDSRIARSLYRYADHRAEIEPIPDAPALIVNAGIADRVSVNPSGAGLAHDLTEAVEHPRSGLDICLRITKKKDIGIRRLNQPLNAGRRIVLGILDFRMRALHLATRSFPPRFFSAVSLRATALRGAARRAILCGRIK